MRNRRPSYWPANSSARRWCWSRWLRSATTNPVSMKVVFDTLFPARVLVQVRGEVGGGLDLDALQLRHDPSRRRRRFGRREVADQAVQLVQVLVPEPVDGGLDTFFG